VIAINLKDRREERIPKIGLMQVEDRETGQTALVDTSHPGLQRAYEEKARQRTEKMDKLFKTLGVDKIDVSAEGSYVEPIVKFFRIREKRL